MAPQEQGKAVKRASGGAKKSARSKRLEMMMSFGSKRGGLRRWMWIFMTVFSIVWLTNIRNPQVFRMVVACHPGRYIKSRRVWQMPQDVMDDSFGKWRSKKKDNGGSPSTSTLKANDERVTGRSWKKNPRGQQKKISIYKSLGIRYENWHLKICLVFSHFGYVLPYNPAR